MHKFFILVVMVVSIISLLSFASAEDVERRQIIAVKVKTPPKIDGILNDAVWEKAQPSEDFIQTSPNRGKPMSQQTSIRILYDDNNIYLGFQCYDTKPDKIFGSEMRRDYDIWEADDHVGFVLDTYHDLRNAYYFATNPMGIRVDSRITDNGSWHKSWDAVWDCSAKRNSQGWSAEFSIPFGQLRFPQKDRHIWGFNCVRSIQRDSEYGCWSSIETSNLIIISNAGELVGLENLPKKYRLEIRPTESWVWKRITMTKLT